jgi:hypothetical protein
MAVYVTLSNESLAAITDPRVHAGAADCRVRADGYLFKPTGLSGTEWTSMRVDPYLILGTVTAAQEFCLDRRSGAVVARSTFDNEVLAPANRDLQSFAACLKIFENSLPFYGTAQDYEETEAAAAKFAEAIRQTDDTVDDPTSFWEMIVHDIASGEYNATDLGVG